MIKVEEFQQFGRDQFESMMACGGDMQKGVQAIAAAYGDYAKKSFADGNAYVEKLAGVKSLDKVFEVQAEYTKSAYESFVAGSQKIADLYVELARQSYKPFENFAARVAPSATN